MTLTHAAVAVRLRVILRTLLALANRLDTNGRDHGRFAMRAAVLTKRLRIILPAAAAALTALSFASSAGAASRCAAAVITGWRDGRINRSYPPNCYRAALRALPEDVRIYSSAEDDINRALLASLARKATSAASNKEAAVKGVVRRLASTKAKAVTQSQAAARQAAVDANASALPIPVLVAAAAALLFVAAAAISVITRRLRRSV